MVNKPALRFTHFGIFAHDLERQAAFYRDFLGFTETDRGQLPGESELIFLSRDPDEHHQIVLVSGRPERIDFNVVNQISLKADSLTTLKECHARLAGSGVREVVPVTHGNAISVYCRDPEGNRIELYVDTPWYVSQPCRVEMPFELSEAELLLWAERHARTLPGFRPRSVWRNEMALKMGMPLE